MFNTLLDETMILGLGRATPTGMLPIPEIQYRPISTTPATRSAARREPQFFQRPVPQSDAGAQAGIPAAGGHFHNDTITALRDIPGLVVGCPSRGDDAATMLRTLAALAQVDGRVSIFLEPIALYMTKDLHEAGDGRWLFPYPAPGEAMALGEGRVYAPEAEDLVVITYGNGVPMRAPRAPSR